MTALPRIVDLTRSLHHLGPATGTQPRPMIFPTVTHESTRPRYDGAFSIASMGVILSDHAGTHVDAWSHLSDEPEAATIDRMPLTDFVARGVIVDVTDADGPVVTGERFCKRVGSAVDRHGAAAVLLRTGAVLDPVADPQAYLDGYRGIGADVASTLVDRGVRLVGTDARSIDPTAAERGADGLPTHRVCLAARMVVCENLALADAPADQPFLFLALPLKLAGATGSPVRAVALFEQDQDQGESS